MANSGDGMPVKIKVKTVISNGNEKETFELTTFGRYYRKGSSAYLQYDEVVEEGTIRSTVKMAEDHTTILRKGPVSMKMVFQRSKDLEGRYRTPFGLIDISTYTKDLSHSFEEDKKKGVVQIIYDLKMQGSHAGTYDLQLLFEEEKK